MKFLIINKKISCFYKKKNSPNIIRILVPLTRFDTFSLLSFWVLPIYIDQTNKLLFLRRNRLRKQILPLLKLFFNPNIEKALDQFIQISIFEKYYFKMITQKIYIYLKKHMIQKRELIYFPFLIQTKIYKQILKEYKESLNFVTIYFLIKYYTKNSKVKNNLLSL